MNSLKNVFQISDFKSQISNLTVGFHFILMLPERLSWPALVNCFNVAAHLRRWPVPLSSPLRG